jgi:hypothetical protein
MITHDDALFLSLLFFSSLLLGAAILHYPNGQMPTATATSAAVVAAAAAVRAAAAAAVAQSTGSVVSVMDPSSVDSHTGHQHQQQQQQQQLQSHHSVNQQSGHPHSPNRSLSSPVTPSSSNLTYQVSRTVMPMDQAFAYSYITNGHAGHQDVHAQSQSHGNDV